MTLVTRFRRHLASLGPLGGPALVAVSGGADSAALLDLLAGSADQHGMALTVAHVDHGIHPDSAVIAAAVAETARSYGLPFESVCLNLGAGATETLARSARYQALHGIADRLGSPCIITAHHADDQIETILLRVFGGSGPAGLAGIAARRGRLLRPLLPFRRAELALHVQERDLVYWSDPSNHDVRHLRAWVRNGVLPELRHRLPDLDRMLARVGQQASVDRLAWDRLLDVLPALDCRVDDGTISVAVPPLLGYDSSLSAAVIAAVARRVGCIVGASRAARIARFLATGSSGSWVPLGGSWRAEIDFGRLRIVAATADPEGVAATIGGHDGSCALGRWTLRWGVDTAPDQQARRALTAWFPLVELAVRPWRPGDRVRPVGGVGRRLVVRCFQETRVPRGRRERWPVVASDGAIVWVPGVYRSDEQLPQPGQEALRVDAAYA